jgi:hypothetical protein
MPSSLSRLPTLGAPPIRFSATQRAAWEAIRSKMIRPTEADRERVTVAALYHAVFMSRRLPGLKLPGYATALAKLGLISFEGTIWNITATPAPAGRKDALDFSAARRA